MSVEPNPYRPPNAPLAGPDRGPLLRPRLIPAAACYFLAVISICWFACYVIMIGSTVRDRLRAGPGSSANSPYSPSPRNLGIMVFWLLASGFSRRGSGTRGPGGGPHGLPF